MRTFRVEYIFNNVFVDIEAEDENTAELRAYEYLDNNYHLIKDDSNCKKINIKRN